MDKVDRILDQWRTERPDLDVTAMGPIGRISRLMAYLRQGMDPVFHAHGLNGASFDVLATLLRSGPPYALTPSELIDWTMVTSGTMTNRIDRLAEAGLVERRPNPEDGRGSLIALTDKGKTLIDRAVSDHCRKQEELLTPLSAEEIETLNALLSKWLHQASSSE
ncbi:MarR family winged helix-turn-helix transcriptional regulator [Halomonas binhaiensis]|uniref:MarR family transcriptional regulator n=1 Tax=Halomonas binhaiensis TaxID=2562282 RepID=A0A5C1NNC1_9GAMM|nr:MarR family transcriptional regulator [Halomonas binhaiensis]QEM83665.1 MarR family transcriptional regulator [Halomonas binhaiensis]